jgi:hypothetical protein
MTVYYAAYAVSEDGPPEDGDAVATTTGWDAWTDFVLDRHEDWPATAHLAEHGWCADAEAMGDELEEIGRAAADPNLKSVTAQVLATLRAMPAGGHYMVTDGEPGDDEEDD